jgi:hypothetical protein
VDVCSKSFAIAGYNFQHARTELRKFRDEDPIELIKKGPKDKQTNGKGAKVFYVDDFDPRMPHPRKLISRNYHHIEHNQTLSKLFPRENLVASCRRLPNLGEIVSPTAQSSRDNGGGGGGCGRNGAERNGSFYCQKFKQGKSCDTCKHLQRETSVVQSYHSGKKFAVHGHLTHLPAGQKTKLRWFIYLLEDTACRLQYVGSTTDVCSRWSTTKSGCNRADSVCTGMYRHFMNGCPQDGGREKDQLRLTLLDFLDTSEKKLLQCGHQPGPQCKCTDCLKMFIKFCLAPTFLKSTGRYIIFDPL